MTWEEYFKQLCQLAAQKSKDRSSKVGCIIVGPGKEIRSTGYNGFIRGADDTREDWYQRPKKYKVTIHAEENAVCNAARTGTSLLGCTAYISAYPCSRCIGALIQAGIEEIVVFNTFTEEAMERWKEEIEIAKEIVSEAGIKFSVIE